MGMVGPVPISERKMKKCPFQTISFSSFESKVSKTTSVKGD